VKFILIILAVLLAVVPVLHTSVGIAEANVAKGFSETGRWVPYTVDFIGSGPFIAEDEQYSAALPANINSGSGVQFNCSGHWFNYKLSGGKIRWWYIDKGSEGTKSIGSILSSQGVASGNDVTYQNAFWGTDARYTAHSYGLREVFILDALPSGVSVDWDETYLEYTGELTWDNGLSVWADGIEHPDKTFRTSGNIDFRDISTGESVFYIPAPTAWDSDGNTCNLVYDVKVSADKIQYGLRVPYEFLAMAVFPVYIDPDNWVSPTGYNDLDSWGNEGYAYDDNTGTKASTALSGGPLELTIGAISCDKVRIYASDFRAIPFPLEANPIVTISVYYSGAYHQIFSGSITKKIWVEKSIGSTETVTKAKISGTLASSHLLYLYEFDFNSLVLPPVVETNACTDVKSTSFDANGDITDDGGDTITTRGFHYSKVFDDFEWGIFDAEEDFEWGSDTDPLDDSGGDVTWTISVVGTSKAEIDTAQHYAGTRSARLYRDGTNDARALFTHTAEDSYDIQFRIRKDETSGGQFFHGNSIRRINVVFGIGEGIRYYDANDDLIFTGSYMDVDTWHLIRISGIDWTTGTYDIHLDDVLVVNDAEMQVHVSYEDVIVFLNYAGTSEIWIDEVVVGYIPLGDSSGAIDWNIVVAGDTKVEIDTDQHYTGAKSARLYCDGSNNAVMYFIKAGGMSSGQVLSFALRKGTAGYVAFWHSSASKYMRLSIPSSELIYYYDGSSHSTGKYVPVDDWCTISFRNVDWDAGTYDIYKDGLLIWTAATMAVSAGYANNTRFYNGGASSTTWIDQVAIWDVEDEDGSFGTGEYSLGITGLDSSTTYYVQAFAKNSIGFGYGNVVSQLTLTLGGYSWGTIIG